MRSQQNPIFKAGNWATLDDNLVQLYNSFSLIKILISIVIDWGGGI